MAKISKRERLLKVCEHIVGGNVDADSVAAFRKATLRYADLQHIETQRALKNLYQSESEVGVMVRKAFDAIDASNVLKELDDRERSSATGAIYPRGARWFLDLLNSTLDDLDDDERDDDERDDDTDDDDVEKVEHYASMVADLLVESGRFSDRPAALHHLLHKPSGQALLSRLHKAAKQKRNNLWKA